MKLTAIGNKVLVCKQSTEWYNKVSGGGQIWTSPRSDEIYAGLSILENGAVIHDVLLNDQLYVLKTAP